MNVFSDFTGYDNCMPPGVRLPAIKIDKKQYEDVDLDPKTASNYSFLRALCDKSMKERGLSGKKEYQDRLKQELETFEELGFTDYILLNWEILGFCHKKGIPTGAARGSCAGSLVLFLIDVTKVDPLKYGLFFERFVSKARSRKIEKDGVVYLDGSLLPDVDSDISFNRRAEVIEFIENKHSSKTCKILTINTLSGKLCIKECGKIVGQHSETEMNNVSDSIPKIFGKVFELKKAYEKSPEFKRWVDDGNQLSYSIARKIEGLNKNFGVHPSGLGICYYPITDVCPLQQTSDGDLVSGYDMNGVADLMVKFDILGLRTLTVIDDICQSLGLNISDINPHDPIIYESLQDLQTPQGLFQLEADTSFQVTKKIKPKNFEQLAVIMAISRPGSLAFVDQYVKFTQGEYVEINTGSPKLDNILKEFGGCILFQETLMKIAKEVFELSLLDAEGLRRATGKKSHAQMATYKKVIEDQAKKLNIVKAGEFYWKVLNDSADYSFNKCLSPDTEVETRFGPKLMYEVEIGEEILGYNISTEKDEYYKVLDKIESKSELYEIEFDDGSRIQCSLQHKCLCEDLKMRTVREIISLGIGVLCK
jgi:DNA polymerase-3 subunit alpha